MIPSRFRKSKRGCFWFGLENSFQAEVERSSRFWLRLTPWSSVFGGNVFVTLKRWKSSKVARRGTFKTGWQNYNSLELGVKVEPFIELPYFTMLLGKQLHDGINSPTFQGFCLNLKHPKHLKLVVKVVLSVKLTQRQRLAEWDSHDFYAACWDVCDASIKCVLAWL